MVKANYDDPQRSEVATTFQAALGSHSLEEVLFVDSRSITATVPPALEPGVYDLLVTDPAGREGSLEAAFTVTATAPADAGTDMAPVDAGTDIASVRDGGADGFDLQLADGPGHDGPATDGPVDAPLADAPPADAPKVDAPAADSQPAVDLAFPDGPFPDLVVPFPDGFSLPDGFVCPPVCVNGCNNGVCQVNCDSGCTCPPGIPCFVYCGPGRCQGGAIDCSQASACYINCVWGSCGSSITCGSGFCWVFCGPNSCQQAIDCQSSCGCSVSCLTSSACSGTLSCPSSCSSCGPGQCNNC
jgi:hypothetical protein